MLEANPIILPHETTCSVCARKLTDPAGPNLCLVRLEDDDPLRSREAELQGKSLQISFVKTPLKAWALYTPSDSLARQEGFHLLFLCCKEDCAIKLADAIVEDATMFANLVHQ